MDDNSNHFPHVNLSDIDLNLEPPVQFDLNQLDSAQERVEAAEGRRLHDQNPIEIPLFPIATPVSVNNDQSTLHGTNNNGRGSFYDCNICFDMASDPVLTCCGHLFCWPCFYQVSNITPTSKECPVCKAEVSEDAITPIYGNGGETEQVRETQWSSRIPPRPRAHRVESIRQRLVTYGLDDEAIEEAIMQMTANIGETVGPGTHGGEGMATVDPRSVFVGQNSDSLSHVTWFLRGADRLMEEVETEINMRDDVLPTWNPYSLRGRSRRGMFVPRRGSGERGRRGRMN